jgi:hypothetical protein
MAVLVRQSPCGNKYTRRLREGTSAYVPVAEHLARGQAIHMVHTDTTRCRTLWLQCNPVHLHVERRLRVLALVDSLQLPATSS